jgi:inner membrane protein
MNESKMRSSVMLRMVIVAFLTLLLLIPALIVESLVSERQRRRDSAVSEVSQKWGTAQTVTGPILTVPLKKFFRTEKGNTVSSIEYAHVLPEILFVNSELDPQIRYRGIYEVVLYTGSLTFTGMFTVPSLREFDVPLENILWKDAFLTIGITDLKGIKGPISLNWDTSELSVNPGVKTNDVVEVGVTANPSVNPSRSEYPFSFQITLHGSEELRVVPIGKETSVTMASNWSDPSFVGDFLPEKREISGNSFRAEWKVFDLNRNFPQRWIGGQQKLDRSAFGVKLILPVDEYQKTMRTAKYAIMFIAFTFISLFMTEILAKTILHPIQYAFIGLALVLFYVLLLSISEQIGFSLAYLVASLAIIGLVSSYARAITSSSRVAVMMCFMLATVYGFLYAVLQLEDYALLLGSVGLFTVLAFLMYLTRKIDWFSLAKSQMTRPAPH